MTQSKLETLSLKQLQALSKLVNEEIQKRKDYLKFYGEPYEDSANFKGKKSKEK